MKYALLLIIACTLFSCKKKGCTDPKALNYDPDVKNDYGLCEYPQNFRVTKVRVEFDTSLISTPQNSIDTYFVLGDGNGPLDSFISDTISNNISAIHEEHVSGFERPIIFDAPLWYHDRIIVSMYNYDPTSGSYHMTSSTFMHSWIYYDNKYPQYLIDEEVGYKTTIWLEYF